MNSGRQPAIVAIGGGTGMPVLLKGLKQYTGDITAIASVADDGGSSGRLREELGMIPPGDIRNCLAALAEADPAVIAAFQHRFETGSLAGHSMGNLFLAAMARVCGDAGMAIERAGDLLEARGRVIPASLDDVTLCAVKSGGLEVAGQSAIMAEPGPCQRVWLEPDRTQAPTEAVAAIGDADLVVLGPGSLFTSLIPNLLIEDIRTAVAGVSCPRVFICNVMTQPGETDGFGASDHLRAVMDHAGEEIIDAVVVNDSSSMPGEAFNNGRTGEEPVAPEIERLESMGARVILADVVRNDEAGQHDSRKLAAAVMSLMDTRDNCRSLPR